MQYSDYKKNTQPHTQPFMSSNYWWRQNKVLSHTNTANICISRRSFQFVCVYVFVSQCTFDVTNDVISKTVHRKQNTTSTAQHHQYEPNINVRHISVVESMFFWRIQMMVMITYSSTCKLWIFIVVTTRSRTIAWK